MSRIGMLLADVVRTAVGLYPPTMDPLIERALVGMFPGATGALPKRGTRELLQAYSTMPWLRRRRGRARTMSSARSGRR